MAVAVLMGVAGAAQAMTFKAYGQVDRALIAADNGTEADVGFVDNSASNTRFGFIGEQQLSVASRLGFKYEVGLNESPSSRWDIHSNGQNAATPFLDVRYAAVYWQGAWGRVSLGKGSSAADGATQVDYSGAHAFGGGNGPQSYFGGISLVSDSGRVLSSFRGAYSSFDGGRNNRLRYDSPSLAGSVLSTSITEGLGYDLVWRFENSFDGGGKIGFALDWMDSRDNGSQQTVTGNLLTDKRFQGYGGSMSILLPSGLNASVAFQRRNYKYHIAAPKSDGSSNYFASVGYRFERTKLTLGYGITRDKLNDGSKASDTSLNYVYDLTSAIRFYGGLHSIKLKDARVSGVVPKLDSQRLNALIVGTRIKFL